MCINPTYRIIEKYLIKKQRKTKQYRKRGVKNLSYKEKHNNNQRENKKIRDKNIVAENHIQIMD